mmetsp:Transcript_5232/g.12947  ORF Transcript_5232/g.12947 Transcript_5232/m.12947 type:complete len:279 (+) Transcript_5232:48-884(+)
MSPRSKRYCWLSKLTFCFNVISCWIRRRLPFKFTTCGAEASPSSFRSMFSWTLFNISSALAMLNSSSNLSLSQSRSRASPSTAAAADADATEEDAAAAAEGATALSLGCLPSSAPAATEAAAITVPGGADEDEEAEAPVSDTGMELAVARPSAGGGEAGDTAASSCPSAEVPVAAAVGATGCSSASERPATLSDETASSPAFSSSPPPLLLARASGPRTSAWSSTLQLSSPAGEDTGNGRSWSANRDRQAPNSSRARVRRTRRRCIKAESLSAAHATP